MKKVISISAEDSVINEFTALAHEFGTNRTNLISMFMVDFIENKKVFFQKSNPIDSIEFESFTDEQNESLMIKGKDTYNSICSSLKGI